MQVQGPGRDPLLAQRSTAGKHAEDCTPAQNVRCTPSEPDCQREKYQERKAADTPCIQSKRFN
eukprot:1150355-Pelagomonas_calceolata.AAC.3